MTTAGSVFLGRSDAPLSERGWQQLRQATKTDYDWQVVVSSPMRRCREFAEQLAGQRNIACHLNSDLREMDFGCWDGQSAEAIYKVSPELLTAFWENPAQFSPPDGEPWAEFSARVRSAWHELLLTFPGQHLLVVGHAGVQRLILAEVLGLGPSAVLRIDMPHAARSRIIVTDGPDSAVLARHGPPVSCV